MDQVQRVDQRDDRHQDREVSCGFAPRGSIVLRILRTSTTIGLCVKWDWKLKANSVNTLIIGRIKAYDGGKVTRCKIKCKSDVLDVKCGAT